MNWLQKLMFWRKQETPQAEAARQSAPPLTPGRHLYRFAL
jgi:hypothetical protein